MIDPDGKPIEVPAGNVGIGVTADGRIIMQIPPPAPGQKPPNPGEGIALQFTPAEAASLALILTRAAEHAATRVPPAPDTVQ